MSSYRAATALSEGHLVLLAAKQMVLRVVLQLLPRIATTKALDVERFLQVP